MVSILFLDSILSCSSQSLYVGGGIMSGTMLVLFTVVLGCSAVSSILFTILLGCSSGPASSRLYTLQPFSWAFSPTRPTSTLEQTQVIEGRGCFLLSWKIR